MSLPPERAAAAVALSTAVAATASTASWRMPSILIATTLAIVIALLPDASHMTSAMPLGIWSLYLFLAAVGAIADLEALVQGGHLGLPLFAFIIVVPVVHGAAIVAYRLHTRTGPDILDIASIANIAGATTALAMAESFVRNDLVLPGILLGGHSFNAPMSCMPTLIVNLNR